MKTISQIRHSRGISMVEGLITVLILAGGMLALFSFQAGLLSSGSSSKARAEAIQIADGKLGELRTEAALAFSSAAAFVADATNLFGTSSTRSESVTGSNAVYTVKWMASNQSNPIRKTVEVYVAWTGQEGDDLVRLETDIRWVNPVLAASMMSDGLPGGGTVASPQGGAEYGDGETRDLNNLPGQTSPGYNDDGTSDNTIMHLTDEGTYELLDASSGEVLLKSSQAFATISGRFYVQLSNGSPVVPLADLAAGAPDISVCRTTRTDDNGNTIVHNYLGTPLYHVINYKCYMGAGWFGKIGPLAAGEAIGTGNRSAIHTCVGSPQVTDTGLSNSRHPQPSETREYRGYKSLTNDQGVPLADNNGNRLYNSSGIGSAEIFYSDNFLIANLGNTVTDALCQSALAVDYAEFANNEGKFVCLSATCPSPLPENTSQPVASLNSWTVSGSITDTNSDTFTIANIITSDGDICTIANDGAGYTCTVYDLGTSWSGNLRATAAANHVVTSVNPYNLVGVSSTTTGVDFVTGSSLTPQTTSITLTFDVGNGVTFNGVSISDGACTLGGGTTYTCTTNTYTGSWNGTITVNHNKLICPDGETSPANGVISGTDSIVITGTSSTILPSRYLSLRSNLNQCP